MSLVKSLLFVYGVALVVVSIRGQVRESGPDETCLGCICEGSTACNVSSTCHVPHQGAYFCGPFLLSYAYWSDAGKPVLANDNPERKGAFENCALDLQCAAHTVRNYMDKFSQDCNNDGKINCEDYIRIHGLGGYDCSSVSFDKTEFYKRYTKCFDVVMAATVPPQPQLSADTISLQAQFSADGIPPQPLVQPSPGVTEAIPPQPQPSAGAIPPQPQPSAGAIPPQPQPSASAIPPQPQPSADAIPPQQKPLAQPSPGVIPSQPSADVIA